MCLLARNGNRGVAPSSPSLLRTIAEVQHFCYVNEMNFSAKMSNKSDSLDTLSRYVQNVDMFRSRWRGNKSATYTVLPKRIHEGLPAAEELESELERVDEEVGE